MRTLLVDDEPLALRRMEILLSRRPLIDVIGTCRDGQEALKLIEEMNPDLVVLDIRMPGRDGFELQKDLRAVQPELDVIFMTGAVHELDAQLIRAIRERAFYFIQKPFDRDVLLTLVERCLELRRLSAAAPGILRGSPSTSSKVG